MTTLDDVVLQLANELQDSLGIRRLHGERLKKLIRSVRRLVSDSISVYHETSNLFGFASIHKASGHYSSSRYSKGWGLTSVLRFIFSTVTAIVSGIINSLKPTMHRWNFTSRLFHILLTLHGSRTRYIKFMRSSESRRALSMQEIVNMGHSSMMYRILLVIKI